MKTVYVLTCAYSGVVNDVLVFKTRELAEKNKQILESQEGFNPDDDNIVLWEKPIRF